MQVHTDDDDACDPIALSKLLRLEWIFVHISALVATSPVDERSDDVVLLPDGIFMRCVELRYTLADDSGAVPRGRSNSGIDLRMRERFGSGRWGWGQGRHVAVEIDPELARLKIRSVEVRG